MSDFGNDNFTEDWGDRNPYSYRPEWNPPLPERDNLENKFTLQRRPGFEPEGYHGRWEQLTVEDFCFLNSCGISVL